MNLKEYGWSDVKITVNGKEITETKPVEFLPKNLEKTYKFLTGKNHHRKFAKNKKKIIVALEPQNSSIVYHDIPTTQPKA